MSLRLLLRRLSTTRADRASSLDLSEGSMTRVGSAVSTISADRVTLGLDSLGLLMMVFEVLRLVLCRLGAGSGVLLRGNSDNLTISSFDLGNWTSS